jgi:hypothetical protein
MNSSAHEFDYQHSTTKYSQQMIRTKLERVPLMFAPMILKANLRASGDERQNEKATRQQGGLFFKGE